MTGMSHVIDPHVRICTLGSEWFDAVAADDLVRAADIRCSQADYRALLAMSRWGMEHVDPASGHVIASLVTRPEWVKRVQRNPGYDSGNPYRWRNPFDDEWHAR
jgi:hypothetical protein